MSTARFSAHVLGGEQVADVRGDKLQREACRSRAPSANDNLINFDRYEQNIGLSDNSGAVARSTVTIDDGQESSGASAEESKSLLIIEEIKDEIPLSILETFQLDEAAYASEDGISDSGESCKFLNALGTSVSRALSGESMVTAPILHSGFPWLGKVTVTPGPLKGNLVGKYRVYKVQAQILAGGHVLPWQIGRTWRYSELRSLLVDSLLEVAQRNDIYEQFEPLFSTFPKKTWQNRNSEEVAAARSKGLELYINRILKLVGTIIDAQEQARLARKNRRRKTANGNRSASASGSSSFSPPSTVRDLGTSLASAFHSRRRAQDGSQHGETTDLVHRKNSMDLLTGKGLGDVMSLIINELLTIDSGLLKDISKLSAFLGDLITSTPNDHCHVTKEFMLTPQQAL